jgi:hypothetical protein
MQHVYKLLLSIFFIAAVAQSCRKTEYEYEKRSENDIRQFVIVGSTGDSVKCLINADTINVYWNPDVALPTTIRPIIAVSEKATVSPASGESVALNENTTFSVTAENGQTRTYRVKIVYAMPIPNVSSATDKIIWMNSTQINIYGEYFLANTDTAAISAYLRRTSDGLEIPLELQRNRITNYSIVANLPEFSAEQEVGLHQLFVKTGDRVGKGIDVNFYAPSIFSVNIVSSCPQAGQDIHAGDSMVINYQASSAEYNGKIAEFYSTDQIATVVLYVGYEQTVDVTEMVRTPTGVRFKIPEGISKYVGMSLPQCRIYYKSVHPDWTISSSYRHNVYFDSPSPIKVN